MEMEPNKKDDSSDNDEKSSLKATHNARQQKVTERNVHLVPSSYLLPGANGQRHRSMAMESKKDDFSNNDKYSLEDHMQPAATTITTIHEQSNKTVEMTLSHEAKFPAIGSAQERKKKANGVIRLPPGR